MSAAYHIFVPKLINDRMAEWNLPSDLMKLVEQQLHEELAADPYKHLRSVNAAWGDRLNLFSFTRPDPADARRSYLFMFQFVFSEDETSLIMVDCGLQIHEAKPDGPHLPS